MKAVLDFLPLLLFFGAYFRFGIYVAVAVVIVATLAQVAVQLIRRKPIEVVLWINVAVVVLFGGATLLFQNETFIKLKPSVLYLVGATVLTVGELLGKSPLRSLLGEQLTLPEPVWRRLTWAWAAFFVFLAGVNLAVAYTCSTGTWVSFKVFGAGSLLIVFALGQSVFLAKYAKDDP